MDHTPEWRDRFLDAVKGFPEVMEVLRLGGQSDYMLRIVVPDMPAYDEVYRRLTDKIALKGVRSRFVMESLHHKFALPI